MDSIPAIYDAGVFRPLGPVNLADGTRAEVIPIAGAKTAEHLTAWPPDYFEQTAGAFAGEEFERPSQGEDTQRENW
jgi:predicted DNA-binding antitoxin AbrB/MazE fold protein